MHSYTFSTITLVCAIAYQVLFSMGPCFADNPKIPPRCYMRWVNCLGNSKDPAVEALCRDPVSYTHLTLPTILRV